MSLTEIGGRASSSVAVRYLIVRRDVGGIEVLRLSSRGEAAPIFSSEEAAESFLASRASGGEWRVRGFSDGEVISLLFAFHESIKWVAPDPGPTEDGVPGAVSRNDLIKRFAERTSLSAKAVGH